MKTELLLILSLSLAACGEAESGKSLKNLVEETTKETEKENTTKVTDTQSVELVSVTYTWKSGDKHFGTYKENSKTVEVEKGTVDCPENVCELETKTLFQLSARPLNQPETSTVRCNFYYFHDYDFNGVTPTDVSPDFDTIFSAGKWSYAIFDGNHSDLLGLGFQWDYINEPENYPCEGGTPL